MTEIKKLIHKTKIMIEHPNRGSLTFAKIDLNKVIVNVFMKDGTRICHEDIESITIKSYDHKRLKTDVGGDKHEL